MNKGYTIAEVAKIVNGILNAQSTEEVLIQELLLDSRKLSNSISTLFFALIGRLDGHKYIADLYKEGVRNFVVSAAVEESKFPLANFVTVKDPIVALQKLASFHRQQFQIPVIGITGSNGKTIVKEWLYQLLHEDYHIVRSPKSYNSQIGVPLSVWQIDMEHNLGIFEAGISEPGEMDKLEKIIRPTIGIFTNIGEPHSEGFLNIRHKTKEKLKLFVNADVLIYCNDHPDINQSIAEINALSKSAADTENKIKTFTWSHQSAADVQVLSIIQKDGRSYISCLYKSKEIDFEIPFTDKASIENSIHCAALLIYLKKEGDFIKEKMRHLSGIRMRLEMKEAINNCTLINDSYNSDIGSIKIAIDFLHQQNRQTKKTVILSDILQSGKGEYELYKEVADLMAENKVSRVIGIGPAIQRQHKLFERNESLDFKSYETTEDFLKHLDSTSFQNELILLKGARKFRFEIISKFLERKAHETVLEINLNAVVHNLKVYHSLLKPETKIMAMVKAFSYGSGSHEIASVLQFNRVDYLAVAYADEGVELRKNGITLPIMVMNPESRSIETMIHYHLEPEIYSLHLLERFLAVLKVVRKETEARYKIHIELETGMNRLGFSKEELPALIEMVQATDAVMIASVFSHLAASEDPNLDEFTKQQISSFTEMSDWLRKNFDYKILRHVLNSNGISRHTSAQFDMVRLGIGLYGLDSSLTVQSRLQNVSTLKTSISQLKNIKAGDTVGYGRVGKVATDKVIATVGIGYADGLSRRMSNGVGSMLVNGKLAPIIGNVCMDMTMLDVTQIEEPEEGDEVVVFGENPRIEQLALQAGTIPYEIFTGISQRVKRVYFQE